MNPVRREVAPGEYLLEFDRVTSTQDIARALYKQGESAIIGVRASYQSAGRGRSGDPWIAPYGTCLLVTYIVPLPNPAVAHQLGMAAAVAVSDSVETGSGLVSCLKWPNDVLIDERKVAGVLVDVVSRGPCEAGALIGIGVNVNIEEMPLPLERRATSMRIEGRRELSVFAFEERVRERLRARSDELFAEGFGNIIKAWSARDRSAGRRYWARIGDSSEEGLCVGVSDSGELRLLLAGGSVVEVVSASVSEDSLDALRNSAASVQESISGN